jgi:hypothetical protein
MNVSALHIFWTFDPTFHVDVTHLFTGEKSVIFQHHVISVPNDDSQFIAVEIQYKYDKEQCVRE